jgi:hypothetical protein
MDENIVEIECAGIGVRADEALAAIEIWVTDQDGRGFRTLIGIDAAPTIVLKFGAAVLRLLHGGDLT